MKSFKVSEVSELRFVHPFFATTFEPNVGWKSNRPLSFA